LDDLGGHLRKTPLIYYIYTHICALRIIEIVIHSKNALKDVKSKKKKLEALDVGSSPPSQAEARAEAGPCELPRVSMRERFTKPD
jgi:hypothetical protein